MTFGTTLASWSTQRKMMTPKRKHWSLMNPLVVLAIFGLVAAMPILSREELIGVATLVEVTHALGLAKALFWQP